jgi:hypothetical protein
VASGRHAGHYTAESWLRTLTAAAIAVVLIVLVLLFVRWAVRSLRAVFRATRRRPAG